MNVYKIVYFDINTNYYTMFPCSIVAIQTKTVVHKLCTQLLLLLHLKHLSACVSLESKKCTNAVLNSHRSMQLVFMFSTLQKVTVLSCFSVKMSTHS